MQDEAEKQILEFAYGKRRPNKEMEKGGWFELASGPDLNFAKVKSTVFFHPYLVFGISNVDAKVATMSGGDVTSEYMMLRVRAETSAKRALGGYFDLSGGYYWFDHAIDGQLERVLTAARFSLTENIDDAWGWSVGTGVRYQVSKNVKVSLGLTQHFVKSTCRVTLVDRNAHETSRASAKMNLNWFSFQGAINIRIAVGNWWTALLSL